MYLLAMRFPLHATRAVMGFSLGVVLSWWGLARAEPEATPRPKSDPRAALERFDSLLEAGDLEAITEARALTVGSARRLFPLLVEAQSKFAPFMDTARSTDTVLEEHGSDSWYVLRVKARAIFRKRMLGLDSLVSVQAVHLYRNPALYRDPKGWRIADFEETDETAPLRLHTGAPPSAEASNQTVLPVSRLAPLTQDNRRITRLRLKVSMRDGTFPDAMGGRRIGAADGVYEIEMATRRLPDSTREFSDSRSEDWKAFLASTPDLDLSDGMLRAEARRLKKDSPHDLETARRIWRYVSENFDYRLGATLFANSREALRERKGDCSEAAVLTAALLRAAGIPSRVMLGFATLQHGVWVGHAWTEAYVGGQWVGIDAALREFPAGPMRVAFRELSGETEIKREATNLMLRTLGNLDIQITQAWAGEKALLLVQHPGAAAESREFWDRLLKGMGE